MQTPNRLTARQVVERIQKNADVAWRTQTVDTYKAGNPDTPVSGIATTFMSTLGLLQRAVKAGRNMIVTHEPTYWNGSDVVTDLKDDPLYARKLSFIEQNNLVIWRFHDHLHARKPDFVVAGLIRVLGWGKYQSTENQRVFVLPSTPLGVLAQEIQKKLKIRAIRVAGNPQTKVSKAALGVGYGFPRFSQDVDLLVGGEPAEADAADGAEYVLDSGVAGLPKGMIVLGHTVSEEAGMDECAQWLRTFVPEVPIEFITSGEPFWAPA